MQPIKLNIVLVMFTYNRSEHTKRVIDSIRNNDCLPARFFIFQDGLKQETDLEEWNKVNKLIKGIDWCPTEIVVSDVNKGLSLSIVTGLNYIFQRYDAAIVLEDDCVIHSKFLDYMMKALEKYALCKQVYSINGYTWPTNIHSNGTDAYFAGRAGSWGWATWKERWAEYKEDYKMLVRIKKDPYARKQIQIWGKDLESYLYGNITGKNDSWAVFWALLVLEKHGFCLTPYESLVDNIGFDGTGVHCGTLQLNTRFREKDNMQELLLPDRIEYPDNYEEAYRMTFSWLSREEKLSCYNKILGSWVELGINSRRIEQFFQNRNIKKIAIWGRGLLCELLLKALSGKVEVLAIVESVPKTSIFKNVPVISLELLPKEIELIVVIPVFDMEEIEKKASMYKLIGLDELLKEINTMIF